MYIYKLSVTYTMYTCMSKMRNYLDTSKKVRGIALDKE